MFDSAKDIYDKLCEVLTNYEDPETEEERTTADDFYKMLVDIQNNWDMIQN